MVVIIVSVVLTFATLSMRIDRRAELLQEEAERLLAVLRLAREEAILTGQEIGLRFKADGYEFLGLEDDRWYALEDDGTFRSRALPPEITVRLKVDGVEMSPSAVRRRALLPQVVLWSSGEVTPFRATLAFSGVDAGFSLVGKAAGTLALERLERAG